MKCANCFDEIKYPRLHLGKRYCSDQCRDAGEKRWREKQHQEWLTDDECFCKQCAPQAIARQR